MKQHIFLSGLLLSGLALSVTTYAQEPSLQNKKSEEIIIRKNGDKTEKMTIEINGDSVMVNGKPLSDIHDGDVTILQRKFMNKDSHNFLYTPNQKLMDFDVWSNDNKSSTPKTFLGVMTEKSENGVKISDVVKNSAAEKAGLLNGDIITRIDAKEIISPENLIGAITAHKPGDEVKLYYLRDNKKKDTKVKLGETKATVNKFLYKNSSPGMDENSFNFKMPPMPQMQGSQNRQFNFNYNTNRPKLGVKIEDTENGSGVKVLNVEEGSPAEKAGLKKDDIITELNGEKIKDISDARDQLNGEENKQSFNVKAFRDKTEMNFEIKIPKKLNSTNL